MDTHWSNLVLHYCDLNKYQPSKACSKDTEEKNLARHLNNPDVWMKSEMWWLFNKEIRMFTITELNLHRKRSLFPDFFSNPKKPGFKPNLRMWVFLWICRKDYFWTFHTNISTVIVMVLCWMGGDHVFAVHQWLYAVQKKKGGFYLDQTNVTEHKRILITFKIIPKAPRQI